MTPQWDLYLSDFVYSKHFDSISMSFLIVYSPNAVSTSSSSSSSVWYSNSFLFFLIGSGLISSTTSSISYLATFIKFKLNLFSLCLKPMPFYLLIGENCLKFDSISSFWLFLRSLFVLVILTGLDNLS